MTDEGPEKGAEHDEIVELRGRVPSARRAAVYAVLGLLEAADEQGSVLPEAAVNGGPAFVDCVTFAAGELSQVEKMIRKDERW